MVNNATSSAATALAATGAAATVVTSGVKALPHPTLPTSSPTSQQPWNTRNLGLRLGADLVSAACAGSLVAPVISIIDRSIMENASGRCSILTSLTTSLRNMLLRPHAALFCRPNALILLLYGGTYLTANTLDTVSSTVSNRPASSVTSGSGKFFASSAANVSLCIYKDQNFVRMFGAAGPGLKGAAAVAAAATPRPVPLPSYALFAIRDCLTIFASFNIPPLLAPHLSQVISQNWQRHVSGVTMAQFLAPAAIQFASTPLHLLGLDLYNRPRPQGHQRYAPIGWRDRWETVRKNWLVSSFARIGRIIPAFGVGGVVNMKVRRQLMTKLD